MKIIIIILFFGLIPIVSFGQNINELLYLKINNYRKKHDLKTLVIENKAKVANDQQLNYMVETSTVPLDHTQLLKSSYVSTFNSFEDRVHFVCAESFEYIGENLIGMIYENSIQITAEQIFQYWVKSPSHNELMLSTEPTGFYIILNRKIYITYLNDFFVWFLEVRKHFPECRHSLLHCFDVSIVCYFFTHIPPNSFDWI